MALKDIRLTFFYSDEAIFDKVKNWRTRERLVKWANEFYKRYGFKIDEYPIPWSEKLYKREFSLAKTNGLKANYTDLAIYEKIAQEILDKIDEDFKKEREELEKNPSGDLTVEFAKWKDYAKRFAEHDTRKAEINGIRMHQREVETLFRVALQKKLKQVKNNSQKQRLPVIFCEFINLLEQLDWTPTLGETFGARTPKLPHLIVWTAALIKGLDMYDGPFVIIDVNGMTRKFDHALAHEVVHAAGNSTRDNQGTPRNIMIYADSYGKAPHEVNLEPSDKAKMEAAFFVL